MEMFVTDDIATLCRTCMAALPQDSDTTAPDATRSKHNICADIQLAEQLKSYTSLPFDSTDVYPKYLCDQCFVRVNDFHQFRAMCNESLRRFEELRQLRASRLFEDEKPNFDLSTEVISRIKVEETNVLADTEERQISALAKPKIIAKKPTRRSKRQCQAKAQLKVPKKEIKKEVVMDPTKSTTEIVIAEQDEIAELESMQCSKQDASYSSHDMSTANFSGINGAQDDSDKDEPTKAYTKRSNSRKRRSTVELKSAGKHQDDNDKPCFKPRTFLCDECPTRFFVEHRLLAHKRTHEGLAPYPCPHENCDKSFNRRHCLSQHLKQHEGTNNWFSCEHEGCGKVYKHKPTLVMHQRKYHQLGPELKKHVCEICGKVFKAFAILNDHRYTHKDNSERPFACDEPNCLRRFTNKEKLKVHRMRHAGIKNYVCPHCGMRKTTRNELKVHINYHTLERTWPCRFCAHVCNSSGNLRMHVRTVHERAKDYACRYCERTFAKPDTRKYHEMTHTGEKPHECLECGKRFTQPAALRTHKKIHERQRVLLAATALNATGESAACEDVLIEEPQQELTAQTEMLLLPADVMDEVVSMQELLQVTQTI